MKSLRNVQIGVFLKNPNIEKESLQKAYRKQMNEHMKVDKNGSFIITDYKALKKLHDEQYKNDKINTFFFSCIFKIETV